MKIYEKQENDFDFDLNKKKTNDFLTLNITTFRRNWRPLRTVFLYLRLTLRAMIIKVVKQIISVELRTARGC